MTIQHAQSADIPDLVKLINSAYRGEYSRIGWSTEADLLEGIRTDESDLQEILQSRSSQIIVVKEENNRLIACIHAYYQNNQAAFGLFAVEPSYQNRGIGKLLLAYAENAVMKKWQVKKVSMDVISCRCELIEYYNRRGYHATGEEIDFPKSEKWQELVDGLVFSVLEKTLTDQP